MANSCREMGNEIVFQTTSWSLVEAAGKEDGFWSLSELVKRYRDPLRAYILCKFRVSQHDAEDLVQGFMEQLVADQVVSKASREKCSRFRAYLKECVNRFVFKQFRKEGAKKRMPEGGLVSFDPEFHDSDASVEADHAFDVAIVRQILTQSFASMRQEAERKSTSSKRLLLQVLVLEKTIWNPIFGGAERPSHDVVRRDLGLKSVHEAATLLSEAKMRFESFIRKEIFFSFPDSPMAFQEIKALLEDYGAAGISTSQNGGRSKSSVD